MENAERNLYYIKGQLKHYYGIGFGSSIDKAQSDYIAYLSDYTLSNINKDIAKGECVSFNPAYKFADHDITLYNTSVKISEYRPATDKEIALFDKAMAAHNLVFKMGVSSSWETRGGLLTGTPKRVEKVIVRQYGTYYKRKADFVIVLNGQPITFKEFRKKGLKEGEKVILHGDNGYSHCWSDTYEGGALKQAIDRIFDRRVVDGTKGTRDGMYRQRRAPSPYGMQCGGWNFDKYGRLVVNTSMTDRHFSMVSDS